MHMRKYVILISIDYRGEARTGTLRSSKKLQYIEAYCPGGSQFLRNCTLLQWLPVQGFILKILSRGEEIVTQRG